MGIIIVYTPVLTRRLSVTLPTGFQPYGAFIMELLISLLVGFGISLVLFRRK